MKVGPFDFAPPNDPPTRSSAFRKLLHEVGPDEYHVLLSVSQLAISTLRSLH